MVGALAAQVRGPRLDSLKLSALHFLLLCFKTIFLQVSPFAITLLTLRAGVYHEIAVLLHQQSCCPITAIELQQ